MNKEEKRQRKLRAILTKYKNLKDKNNGEIGIYYDKLRDMIKFFNQIILDATLKGATIILAVLAAIGYLANQNTFLKTFGPLLLIICAIFLGHNLRGQVKFFAEMMRQTIRITEHVEALLLSFTNDKNKTIIPYDILITYHLRKDFPGTIHVKRREIFFTFVLVLLWIIGFYYLYECIVFVWDKLNITVI